VQYRTVLPTYQSSYGERCPEAAIATVLKRFVHGRPMNVVNQPYLETRHQNVFGSIVRKQATRVDQANLSRRDTGVGDVFSFPC